VKLITKSYICHRLTPPPCIACKAKRFDRVGFKKISHCRPLCNALARLVVHTIGQLLALPLSVASVG